MPTNLAKAGDTVTLSFVTSFPIIDKPTVTFANIESGRVETTNDNDDDGITWKAEFDVISSDDDGDISFTVTGKDYAGVIRQFTVPTYSAVTIDTTPPVLDEETAITTPSTNQTPSYVFTSTEQGTISTSISQGISTTNVSSNNDGSFTITVTFNVLGEGTYENQTITVTDNAGNASNLTIPDFVIDTSQPSMTITAATVSGTNISSGSVTNDTSIVLTFTSTENTTDFVSGDIDISDGSLGATFSGSEKVYTVTLTTTTDATYTIDVDANKFTDAAGNGNTAAQQFTWTRDTTAPVVTVNTGTDTVELGGTWTDAGATATDASGAVTVVTTGTVDTNTVGDYIITYTSTDGSGNIGTATRTVNVVDTTGDN